MNKLKKILLVGILLFIALPFSAFAESDVKKSMEVDNPELQYSPHCRIKGDTAYITITSIGSYNTQDIWCDLQLVKKNKMKKLVVYLNSPGGAAHQGMAITDEFRIFQEECDIPIIIEARGLVASAAIPVLASGSKRICSRNTMFLIHPAALLKWGFFSETLKDLESQATMIRMLRENYANILVKHTKLTKEQVFNMMEKDTWFTAQTAKEYGLVDKIK
jgi:ATP-dependent Clp protease protease subunit